MGGYLVKRATRALLKDFIELIYPPLCPCCGMEERMNNGLFCLYCYHNLPFTTTNGVEHALVGKDEMLENVTSLFYYDGSGLVKEILQEIKYKNNRKLAYNLGRVLGKSILKQIGESKTIIIPVPLHTKKLRQRGYNQAEEIGRGIQAVVDLPLRNVLRRKTHHISATRVGKEQRMSRLMNAYGIKKEIGEDIHQVVIVDDVITTGATIKACKSAIKNSSFKGKIIVASLAITI